MTKLLSIPTLALALLLAGGCEDQRAAPEAPASESAPAPTNPSEGTR